MFLKIANDVTTHPYNINLLYAEYPNTSFPNNIESDFVSLLDFGVHRVNATEKPSYDALLQKCVELAPVLVADEWTQQWQVESLSAPEAQALYDSTAAEVRANRYRLLIETDWTQLKDVSLAVSNTYTAYRQELRDVSDQPGFPFSITWPALPS